MTREAKIGMLTGLGVIVFIGVLLSNYLGDPKAAGATSAIAAGPTGRMADLPVGEQYRQQVMQPVGVPPMAGPGPRTMRLADGSEITTPIDATYQVSMPPTAFAADRMQNRAPVTAVDAGPIIADPRQVGGPPIITLADTTRVPVRLPAENTTVVPPTPPAPAQATYVIAAGDSLGKISKKFYSSSKNSDVQRIVAANPGMLKDATTMLVVGKKLVIPGVVVPAAPVAPMAGTRPAEPVTIYLPGDLGRGGPLTDSSRRVQAPTRVTPPVPAPAAPKTYVVQSGDTLEKIARRLSPAKAAEMVQKIASMNALKDPNALQVGLKLKVPG